MKLTNVIIHNYRSIEDLDLDITKLADETYTYGLIGENEAGKSTILKALALKDGIKNQKNETLPLQKEFKDPKKPIEIEYYYELEKNDIEECKTHLSTQIPDIDLGDIDFSLIKLNVAFSFTEPNSPQFVVDVMNLADDNINKSVVQEQLKAIVNSKTHKSIFWTAEDRFLISQPVNLAEFVGSPEGLSVPLRNSFLLAGIQDISERVNSISESTEREQLKNELGEAVTKHINSAWPGHKIRITFDISDGLINFHVHDQNAKGKAKTADQRSDGFGQFISFLLTVSAQNKNNELKNTILLLDEPETHLHPQAQEDLLKELIKISQGGSNNIAFFATHSNYMIDKTDLSRNFKISKPKDVTEKKQFDKKESTYASVSYEVFGIASTDYHNQLYDELREIFAKKDAKRADNLNIKQFDEQYFKQEKKLKKEYPFKDKKNDATLPTYIRNSIHYPINKDQKFNDNLKQSIELLRSFEEQ